MKCCNIKVPMKALAEKLKPLLGLDKYVEKDGLCTLGVTNQSAYTVKDTDDVIVSSGGTITFPSSIPVGRAFTVIQAADTAVVLASDGTINPPSDKTLTMYGKNAVATVIKTGANVFYVSGDMQ